MGESPLAAAFSAARELSTPIITMTIVLIAVYVPIGFQTGLTGALFTEFAFTLAAAVTVSAVVALTLTPMACSRLLRRGRQGESESGKAWLIGFIDRRFGEVHWIYMKLLRGSLNTIPGDPGICHPLS